VHFEIFDPLFANPLHLGGASFYSVPLSLTGIRPSQMQCTPCGLQLPQLSGTGCPRCMQVHDAELAEAACACLDI
jgi:hypothetical protein